MTSRHLAAFGKKLNLSSPRGKDTCVLFLHPNTFSISQSASLRQSKMSSRRQDFIKTSHKESYDYISPLNSDLSGRQVLITGTAWEEGVGYATALAFARAGASVIAIVDLHDISKTLVERLKTAAVEAKRPEPRVLVGKADISSRESVFALKEQFSEGLNGRLDVLVNNAAAQEPYSTILDSDPEVYWKTWEVNVGGLFNMTRAFLPLQLSTPGGLRIMINVSSSGALSVRKHGGGYRSSKLGVLRWTESLHMDYEDDGLIAFCVNPGAIRTRMTVNETEAVRNMLPHKPEIAGDTIAWLAMERREWLGGRYVSCPWDMEELMSRREEIVEGDKLKLKMVF